MSAIRLTFIVAGNNPDPSAPPPSIYQDAARRFAETYKANPAGAAHELIIVNTNAGLTDDIAGYFDGIPHRVAPYNGTGWDIGAHQHVAAQLPADDWLMCFSSWAWFRQPGWLAAFVAARDTYGDALYGSTASLERNPHVRGTGFFVRVDHVHRYPRLVNSRTESFEFESGIDSLTMRCIHGGFGPYLVTPGGVVDYRNLRTPPNIFRRGDQSNIWTFDKHTDAYDRAGPAERQELSRRSDGPHYFHP